jgi:hypothetical protein
MKKITLIMLVALVPFMTMAQKKSKKGKKNKIEKVDNSNASYEFMVITGYNLAMEGPKDRGGEINSEQLQVKKMIKSTGKMIVSFDFGGIKSNDTHELFKNARNYRSMAAAVNGAANYGWEFVSANVVNLGETKLHYYYMRKAK